jgi:PilZ domain-containing protein
MTKGRYGGSERRRSPRYDRRFRVSLEYEGKNHEIRTIDISEYGVLIPRRMPPPIGTHIKLTLTIRDETSIFEGVVIRHTKCLINGVQTTGVGIDFFSPEYQDFVKAKILIA